MDRQKLDDKNTDEIKTSDIVFHARIADIKVKDDHDEDDDLFIEGFASTEDIDRVDDIVEATAFKKTMKDFMKNPSLMLNHSRENIGKVVEAEIREGKGFWVKAFISKAEEKLRTKIKEGVYKAFSFGFRILDSAIERRKGKDIRIIKGLELLEVSVVSIPANRRALFSVAKAFELGTDLIYEDSYVKGLEGSVNLIEKRIEKIEKKYLLDYGDRNETVKYIQANKNQLPDYDEQGRAIIYPQHIDNIKAGKLNLLSQDVLESAKQAGLIKDQTIDEVHKPEPEETANEIRIRRKSPGLFQSDSFKRITIKKDKPRVNAIIGRLKGRTSTEIQSYRFPKVDGWTISKASSWVKGRGKSLKLLRFLLTDDDYNTLNEKKIDFEDEWFVEDITEGSFTSIKNLEGVIELDDDIDKCKELEKEIEEVKAGRVLSSRNKTAITKVITALEEASTSLKTVIAIDDSNDSRGLNNSSKEEKENKTDKKTATVMTEVLLNDALKALGGQNNGR